MRIGVVTASYPRHEGDAAGNFVGAHVAALRSAGHVVDVIGAHTNASDLFYGGGAPDELESRGIRGYLEAGRFTARLALSTMRGARRWDLVIAHWLVPSALAAVPTRAPLLAIAHGGDVHTLRRLRLLAPMLHLLRLRGARLAFVSHELRQIAMESAGPSLRRYLEDAAIVQPMGLDVARFAELRRARQRASPARIVVVARLVPIKGIDIAIAAHRLLRQPVELVIAGDGPEQARLRSLASGQQHSRPGALPVTFLGEVDGTTRDDLLRSASIVVVPSRILPNGRTEGTPMIALEALEAGVPVIASHVGGLRDLSGITHVPPDDPLALASAIEAVLDAVTDAEDVTIDSPATQLDLSDRDWGQVSNRLLAHAFCQVSPAICAIGDTSTRRSA